MLSYLSISLVTVVDLFLGNVYCSCTESSCFIFLLQLFNNYEVFLQKTIVNVFFLNQIHNVLSINAKMYACL